MKVERIDHVHIVVKDMGDKAARFFTEILGSRFVGPIENADHRSRSIGWASRCSLPTGKSRRDLFKKAGCQSTKGYSAFPLGYRTVMRLWLSLRRKASAVSGKGIIRPSKRPRCTQQIPTAFGWN